MNGAAFDRLSERTVQYLVKPCAIAGFFVFVAFLWTLLIQHDVAYPFVFLFLGAVMGSAWFGGIIAGLVSIALSSILLSYFFIPPLYSFAVAGPSQTYLVAFVLCALAIGVISAAQRRSDRAVREARNQLETKVLERTAELRQANFELQESGRRLHALSEAIPQQMWSADAAGVIEFCNQHLTQYVGKSVEGPIEEAFSACLHPVDDRAFRQAWLAASAKGGDFELDARVLGADRVYRWFLIRITPRLAPDGTVAQWYGIHIDIEQKYRAQQGLTVAQDELSRLSRTFSLGELSVSIAHELNQPLTAVVTQAYACREWLRADPPNLDKAATTAERIVQESTRASAVVSRVRALFRNETPIRVSTDMNRLIAELARLLRDEAIAHNTSIRLALAESLPNVEVDPVQIQQVLFNLAMNAMDSMCGEKEPHELTIRSESRAGEILITVADNGPGLTPEATVRMFEPFFTTKPHGTGMGLSICRSIVEAHEGKIWAANGPGGGAEFHFSIRIES